MDHFFEVSQRKSNFRTEILAGLTTFITMAYILVLNPQIMAEPYELMGDAAMAQKIANGVAVGLILHCVMKVLTGRIKEIKPLTLIVALIFVVHYAFVSM